MAAPTLLGELDPTGRRTARDGRCYPTRVGDVIYADGSPALRKERVRRWLGQLKKPVTDGILTVLASCGSGAEVLLALPFASRPDVSPNGEAFVGPTLIARPQVKVGRYRADWVVERGKRKLVVEVDGLEFHRLEEKQVQQDYIRQRRLVAAGYTVIRFTALEVFNDAAECWRQVEACLGVKGA